jgi:alkylation response protein AidB-like acyl-CoA dehydrogenase
MLENNEQAEAQVAIAKAWTGDAYKSVSLLAHQLWGGMGYALESDLYLYSNRAKATELSFGTSEYHLNSLADVILGPA